MCVCVCRRTRGGSDVMITFRKSITSCFATYFVCSLLISLLSFPGFLLFPPAPYSPTLSPFLFLLVIYFFSLVSFSFRLPLFYPFFYSLFCSLPIHLSSSTSSSPPSLLPYIYCFSFLSLLAFLFLPPSLSVVFCASFYSPSPFLSSSCGFMPFYS